MKKDAEIKIIEEIKDRVIKLYRADSYFREDMKHGNVQMEDFDVMTQNIKNDFPILHNTKIQETLTRAIHLYKQKSNQLAKMLQIKANRVRFQDETIKYLQEEIEAFKKARQAALESIVAEEMAGSPEEVEFLRKEIYKTFPDSQVIITKLRQGFQLTPDELEKVKTSLYYNPH